ncbi:hypothetical protein V6N11_034170 [Hibiscus sabdariffa]|uniref:Uncharacterized protein n=1 Tax=Hibiscus sabdariffa TaxID=183260 RepID=A0ABR2S2B5_9ROSI
MLGVTNLGCDNWYREQVYIHKIHQFFFLFNLLKRLKAPREKATNCWEEQRNNIDNQLSRLESIFEENPWYLKKIQNLLSKEGIIFNSGDCGVLSKSLMMAREVGSSATKMFNELSMPAKKGSYSFDNSTKAFWEDDFIQGSSETQ